MLNFYSYKVRKVTKVQLDRRQGRRALNKPDFPFSELSDCTELFLPFNAHPGLAHGAEP